MFELLPGAEFEISAEIKDHNGKVRKAEIKESNKDLCLFEVLNESGKLVASVEVKAEVCGNSACLNIKGEMALGAGYMI